jgi:hypothetical protein
MLHQYNRVRVVSILNKENVVAQTKDQRRSPRVSDIATILEIQDAPLAYELECSDETGTTQWEGTFLFTDLLIERVS